MKDWSSLVQILVAVSFLCVVGYYGTQIYVLDIESLLYIFTFSDYVNHAIPIMIGLCVVSLFILLPLFLWSGILWVVNKIAQFLKRKFGKAGVSTVKIIHLTSLASFCLVMVLGTALLILDAFQGGKEASARAILILVLVVVPILGSIAFKRSLKHYPMWNVTALFGAPFYIGMSMYFGYAFAEVSNDEFCKLVTDYGYTVDTHGNGTQIATLDRGVVIHKKGQFVVVPWDRVRSYGCSTEPPMPTK